MPLWAVIYWIVAISLFLVFIYRRVNARKAKQFERSTTDGTRATRTDSTPSNPAEKVWPAPPPPAPDDETFRLDDALETPAQGDDIGVGAEHPTEAPGAVASTSPPGEVPPSATLPELLAGITLPHELVPLTQIDVPLDLATHVVVATEKANAETVAAGLTTELDRLGYEVQRESMTKLTAMGPRGTVSVEIHPDGANVVDGGTRRFPTAAERMVVVELHAG